MNKEKSNQLNSFRKKNGFGDIQQKFEDAILKGKDLGKIIMINEYSFLIKRKNPQSNSVRYLKKDGFK